MRRTLYVAGLTMLMPVMLGGCVPDSPERSESLAACRAETDRVYNAQNRYQLSEPDASDSPLSGVGPTQSQNSALSDQYQRGLDIDACMREHTGSR